MKAVQIRNGRGRPVVNQLIVYDDDDGRTFQSYDTAIVHIDKYGDVTLDKRYWDYSNTTGRYRNHFLGETKAETERKIKSGEYTLGDLN